MENPLESYRRDNGLTYRALAKACRQRSVNAVFRHCKGANISAESALIYSETLGIPRSKIRPDLWPPETTATPAPLPAPASDGEDA